MTKNAFFAKVEWRAYAYGFCGEFHGDKLYSIEYETEREKLVNQSLQIMKDRHDSTITFECFCGYESISLLRIFYDCNGMTKVWWENGNAQKVEHIPINKRNIRKAVDEAIAKFYAIEER